MSVPDLLAIDVKGITTPPDITQLTTKSLTGTGVFDVLMYVVKMHLQDEFDSERIDGTEYATVYMSALGAVLQQSISFLLNHQSEKKTAAEIGLIRQKTVTELANTDNDIPEGLGFNGSPAVEGLIASKLALDALQSELVESQVATDKAGMALIGQKIITELAQTDNAIGQAKVAGYGFNDNDTVQGILEGAIAKSAADALLSEQKVVTELAQTSIYKPSDLGQDSATLIGGMAEQQVGKTTAEKILLSQKTITELAQTSDAVTTTTDALNTTSVVSGSVKKQQVLYQAQADGFARDAEQKLAKMLLETWSVDATVGDATANYINQLDDSSVGAVIAKAKTGIGVTQVSVAP